jgi:hypothetical protein
MSVAIKEMINYEALLEQVQRLSPEQQVRLIFSLAKQLPIGFQTKLIVLLLPDVAPTIEAVLHNQVARPIAGKAPEDAIQLLKRWWEDSASDEDEDSWDEVMQRLGAYETGDDQLEFGVGGSKCSSN